MPRLSSCLVAPGPACFTMRSPSVVSLLAVVSHLPHPSAGNLTLGLEEVPGVISVLEKVYELEIWNAWFIGCDIEINS